MPRRVLLIDDSSTIRSITKVYLMALGAEFVDAEHGERGLQLARLLRPDLIIADIKMPQMDGLTFVRLLRDEVEECVRRTPVIFLTSDKDEDLRRRGLEAGADAFITKPVTGPALLEAVRALLAEPR